VRAFLLIQRSRSSAQGLHGGTATGRMAAKSILDSLAKTNVPAFQFETAEET